ncbi:hypothetical protein OY671_010106, partial [Metschnikowia pulcherrima]
QRAALRGLQRLARRARPVRGGIGPAAVRPAGPAPARHARAPHRARAGRRRRAVRHRGASDRDLLRRSDPPSRMAGAGADPRRPSRPAGLGRRQLLQRHRSPGAQRDAARRTHRRIGAGHRRHRGQRHRRSARPLGQRAARGRLARHGHQGVAPDPGPSRAARRPARPHGVFRGLGRPRSHRLSV